MQAKAKKNICMSLVMMLLIMASACQVGDAAESVPAGFELTTFATGFTEPVALATTPDGRVFVAEKGGNVWVVSDVNTAPSLFVSIEAYTASECGLLGMALDPDYAANRYVYFFVTVTSDEQRIIRYTDQDDIGADATIIRAGLPTSGQVHNGGGLRFGPDSKLYFSIGDTGQSELSQQMQTFAGKICRINPDGSTPDDNPFTTPTGTPRAIFALGFRNPFRFCFAPDGRLFVMDVGSNGESRREEINLVQSGDNGGWPVVEGVGQAEVEGTFIQPLVAYGEQGAAITGCVVYDQTQFPSQYRGGLFHLDFVSNKMFFMSLGDEVGASHAEFMQAENGVTDLTLGPDGGLLYTEMFTGNIKHLRFATASAIIVDDLADTDNVSGAQDNVPNDRSSGNANRLCGNGMALMMIPIGVVFASFRKHGRCV